VMKKVAICFDFISPYSHLALIQLRDFATKHAVEWELRPVVYAKLLENFGLTGPAEVDARRNYAFADVLRSAHLLDTPLLGPPAHPFRSLEALRTACLFRGDERGQDLVVALSRACWAEGKDLTQLDGIAQVVESVGLSSDDLASRIASDDNKAELRRLTDEAIAAGVFGVPSFIVDDEIFWGQDRMDALAARLSGRLPSVKAMLRRMLDKPRGVERRK
jgi:2-hydroxychromene-2-carboxylate isomerase